MQTPSTKPLLVFGSRHGSLFNLTPANIPKLLTGVQLSIGDFYDAKCTLQHLPEGMTIKKFLGYPENVKTYLSPYDFYKKECVAGCQDTKKVKIKCAKGFTPFSAADYDQLAGLIRPDYLVTLTEYPCLQKDNTDSNRRQKRAINKTSHYLQHSEMTKHSLPGIKILAAVHGGLNKSLVARSLQQILPFEVDGLAVCDLCQGETLEEREEIYQVIAQRLGRQQKQRELELCLTGLGKLEDIEHALKFGYRIFEVNYPFVLAQQETALVRTVQGKYIEKKLVRQESMKPLSSNCCCLTCSRHSEAYIAHLLECFELNGKVLLSIHNLQAYMEFMRRFND